jgi:SecD/SecF fusion protein
VERYLQEAGISEIELLVATDDRYDVSGAHLRMVSRALDETGQPCLNFAMGGDGTARMGGLTGSAIPTGQPPFYRSLGILLDGELLSAPRVMSTISDRGRLTGRFTQEEVDFLVGILQAGSLPVALQKTPVSQATVNPSQAARRLTTIAAWATLAGLAIIWLALLLRYRWIGLGAVLTSLLHGLIVLVTIELLRVPVTQLLTIASSVMLLVIAAGTALVCESVRRRFFAGKSVWRGLLRGVVPLGVLLVFLTILGVVAYVLGDFAVRNAAVAVAAGSVVGIATCCVVLPLLIALLAAARRNRDGDDAVIEAHVVA